MSRFGMPWGSVELEAEVTEWVGGLPAAEFGRAEFYIDRLAERGPLLDQPYTRQLRGKLRELRFYLGSRGDAVRVSYFIAAGRRIILLTVFRKQRQQERAEIDRAYKAMQRCIEEKHVAEENGDETK
jgi:phage-related protein